MALIGRLLGFLLPVVFGGASGSGAQKAGAAGTSLVSLGALSGGALWLLGPGREWEITLNGLELAGVGLGLAVVLEWFRRQAPPPP